MRVRRSKALATITVAVATSVVTVVLTATAPALGHAPAASPDASGASSPVVAAPVPSPASLATPVTSAGGDGLILFAEFNGACTTLHTIRPDGSDDAGLDTGCLVDGRASWGPTSWSSTGDGVIVDGVDQVLSTTRVYEVHMAGGPPRVLMTPDGADPAFSPDGSQVAYVGDSATPDTAGIFIAAADGTHPHQLVSLPDPLTEEARDPHFSPDGSRLVFDRVSRDGLRTVDVWMVNTDGTDLHQLTAALSSQHARWSPDGSHLLFEGTTSGTGPFGMDKEWEVWAIDADGTGLTRIISQGTSMPAQYAAWSPDGSRIVFTYIDPGTGVRSLRVTNTDGSGVATLLSTEGQTFQFQSPDWGLPRTDVP